MSGTDPNDLVARFAMGRTLPETLPPDPMPTVKEWFDLAQVQSGQPNPSAMSLATADERGRPSSRIVLCKAMNAPRGHVTFFTNYNGRKGQVLAKNPYAATLFHWDTLDRQIRIEGPVVKSPPEESDAYFAGRPWESRLSAWASNQSEPIASREELLRQLSGTIARLGLDADTLGKPGHDPKIPRPPHWGGYRLWAQRVELWLGGPGRFHDRAFWIRPVTPGGAGPAEMVTGPWTATRLQP
jgi:pyridoxamine 5'-phosphate oxidase